MPDLTVDKKYKLLAFLFISFISLIVFYPSFFHVTRADQTIFLIETADFKGLGELFSYSYSYCRTRVIYTGDQFLFRPGFYLLLSLEKWLFGYNFFLWQVTGYILHVLLLWRLFRILYFLRAGIFAVLAALNFGVLFISQEMVIWHHINGYILALIFILLALEQFLYYLKEGQAPPKRLWAMIGWLTLACFTCEFGLVCSLVLLMAAWIHRKYFLKNKLAGSLSEDKAAKYINHPLLLSLPVIVYSYVSFLDYALRNLKPAAAGTSFDFGVLTVHFLNILKMALIAPFVPIFLPIQPEQRTFLYSLNMKDILAQYSSASWAANLNAVLVVLALVFTFTAIIQFHRKNTGMAEKERNVYFVFGAASLTCALGYIFMTVIGRLADRQLFYMLQSLYHFYTIILFLWIAVFAFGCLFVENKKFLKSLLLTVLIGSIFLNAFQSYRFNLYTRGLYAPWREMMVEIDNFVEKHKNEKDFSMNILWRDLWSPMVFNLGSPITGEEKRGYLLDFLYRNHINFENPKYYLVYFNDSGLQVFENKEKAQALIDSKKSKHVTTP